jgi:hypothetical protein
MTTEEKELEEREPREQFLFHYTSKLEYLKDMLEHGIWPRFCEEDFEWLVDEPVRLAFPMICFCDIPLDAAEAHRNRYGQYAVGFSKAMVGKLDINPIWYVHQDSGIAQHLGAHLKMRPRFDLTRIKDHPLTQVLAFIKPVVGAQPDRGAIWKGANEVISFDDEMEWRHIPVSLRERWILGESKGFVKDEHHALSENLRLEIPIEKLEYVFVPHESEAKELVNRFPPLENKVRVWAQRSL